jgi:hypothetical protein
MARKYKKGYKKLSESARLAYHRKADKEYQRQNRKKKKARNKITNAVRDKRMKRPAGKEAHHLNYKTNKYKWVVRAKHRAINRK